MLPRDPSDDLVVSTPERVAFQYPVAGLGSRFLAQVLDGIVIGIGSTVITFLMIGLGALTGNGTIAVLGWILLQFLLISGYFIVSEAISGGQTIGKRALRLRVIGDQGEPIGFSQSAIRNLVRIVDLLPFFYAIGILTIFINGRGKRLGDLAAGTLVVRDREHITLFDLASVPDQGKPAPLPEKSATSIWDTPSRSLPSPLPSAASPLERLEPSLHRLVVAYAARRNDLPIGRRELLASSAEAALRRALPQMVETSGPLAALDYLAELQGVTPKRPFHPRSGTAQGLGFAGLACILLWWIPFVGAGIGLICALLALIFGLRALKAIRRDPGKLQGEEQAKRGRLLGIIGLIVNLLVLVLYLVAFTRG